MRESSWYLLLLDMVIRFLFAFMSMMQAVGIWNTFRLACKYPAIFLLPFCTPFTFGSKSSHCCGPAEIRLHYGLTLLNFAIHLTTTLAFDIIFNSILSHGMSWLDAVLTYWFLGFVGVLITALMLTDICGADICGELRKARTIDDLLGNEGSRDTEMTVCRNERRMKHKTSESEDRTQMID